MLLLIIHLFISLFFSALVLFIYFYVALFLAKSEYKREEFTDFGPYFKYLSTLDETNNERWHTIVFGIVCYILPFLLTVSKHWFVNSVLLFALLYYIIPLFLSNKDFQHLENQFLRNILTSAGKHYKVPLFFFGISLLSGFSRNWFTSFNTSFIYYGINLFASIILLCYILDITFDYRKVINNPAPKNDSPESI